MKTFAIMLIFGLFASACGSRSQAAGASVGSRVGIDSDGVSGTVLVTKNSGGVVEFEKNGRRYTLTVPEFEKAMKEYHGSAAEKIDKIEADLARANARTDYEQKAVQLWITIETRCNIQRGKVSVECESVADDEVSQTYRDWLTFKDKWRRKNP